jgi:hypothetical protein
VQANALPGGPYEWTAYGDPPRPATWSQTIRVATAANAVLRFAIELTAYASFGYWSASLAGPEVVRGALAIAAPLLIIVVWARLLAPRARRRLRDPTAILTELSIFAIAAIALASTGWGIPAAVFGGVAAVNAVLIRHLERDHRNGVGTK